MTEKLQWQKKQLQLALGYLNIIEAADKAIEQNRHVRYFEHCRKEGIDGYANAITDFVGDAIVDTKILESI